MQYAPYSDSRSRRWTLTLDRNRDRDCYLTASFYYSPPPQGNRVFKWSFEFPKSARIEDCFDFVNLVDIDKSRLNTITVLAQGQIVTTIDFQGDRIKGRPAQWIFMANQTVSFSFEWNRILLKIKPAIGCAGEPVFKLKSQY